MLNFGAGGLAACCSHHDHCAAYGSSTVLTTMRAHGQGIWCSFWLNHEGISLLCWPRPTQSHIWTSMAPCGRYKSGLTGVESDLRAVPHLIKELLSMPSVLSIHHITYIMQSNGCIDTCHTHTKTPTQWLLCAHKHHPGGMSVSLGWWCRRHFNASCRSLWCLDSPDHDKLSPQPQPSST